MKRILIKRSVLMHVVALDLLLILSSHAVVLAPSKHLEPQNTNGNPAIATSDKF